MNGGLKGNGRLEGRSIEAFFFLSLCSFVFYHIPYKWSVVVVMVEVEVVMVLSNERKRRRGEEFELEFE